MCCRGIANVHRLNLGASPVAFPSIVATVAPAGPTEVKVARARGHPTVFGARRSVGIGRHVATAGGPGSLANVSCTPPVVIRASAGQNGAAGVATQSAHAVPVEKALWSVTWSSPPARVTSRVGGRPDLYPVSPLHIAQ